MESTINHNNTSKTQKKQQKSFFLLIFSLFTTSLLIVFSIFTSSVTIPFHKPTSSAHKTPNFIESNLHRSPTSKNLIPKIAYLISGSKGDGQSLKRTLKALYHPLNKYAVHLDLEASPIERMELVQFVNNEYVFKMFGNVRVVSRSNLVTYRGPTMVSNTLHAAAILLKEFGDWDWFVNLSASDYPLVTQDDLLHTLSTVPRDLNFIEHTSDIGWKEWGRAKPVIIDPGLYTSQKSDVFWVPEPRTLPTAFKLFTGSAWMMLSRPFIEYCLWGWDNLPRTVLMYYANFLSSPEGYFHTVICNSEEFRYTTVNHDLHYISWDNPPQQHPHFLTVEDYQQMVDSNAPFARKFGRNETVLDKIDSELLGRDPDGYVPGGWLEMIKKKKLETDDGLMNFSVVLRPGPGLKRVKRFITGLIKKEDFRTKQCV